MTVSFHSRVSSPVPGLFRSLIAWGSLVPVLASVVTAEDAAPAEAPQPRPMYIAEYRVQGAKKLPAAEVQEVVYPFLGPGKLPADVDRARAALEKAYHDKGYQAVSVQIPTQKMRRGVVVLQVNENPVGRLRIRGSRYTSPSAVTREAPSMAEGEVVDFNRVNRDVMAMNQYPGRQVTPALRPGVEPGTVDIDLNVKDEMPLHGSLELNNRYSADTTPLRLNGALSYDNLWQLGHTLGLSFQIAPENLDDAKVFSGYYLVRVPDSEGWSVMLQGTKQDSNVSTLGGLAVAGRGEILGLRAIKTLPPGKELFHSFSLGLDYKHFDENVTAGTGTIVTPITYYPFSALYTATLKGKKGTTDFNGGVTLHFRGMGDDTADFDAKRYKADGSFFYFRGELAHTHELPGGLQAFGRIQGQASSQALINSEQFAAGGLGTVRGFLESEVLGDDALAATFELRSPSLLGDSWSEGDDWRVYLFTDAAITSLHDALPGQDTGSTLSSAGLGMRGRFFDHLNGSLDIAYPLTSRPSGEDRDVMYTFRLWGDF